LALASVVTLPPQERPTKIAGPSCRFSARQVAAASSPKEAGGFCPMLTA
jgi:hypothetical protein